MASSFTRSTIPGSKRAVMSNAKVAGAVPANQQIEITVRLRSGHDRTALHTQTMSADKHPANRKILSREEFASKYGASADDVAKIETFAKQNDLSVTSIDRGQRHVVLSGTVAAMNKAFGTTLEQYQHPNGTYRGRVGELTAPNDIVAIIEGVFGLDDRPQASAKFQVRQKSKAAKAKAPAADSSFTVPQVAKIYNFPQGGDGSGQCIGLIELGGGSRSADIKAYFSGLGITAPKVTIVAVDKAKDKPTTANSADGEVMLDIEVAGAVAPGAAIAVYFAPNTDRGFLDAVTTAIHDAVNKPSVISISWGGAEVTWTQQAMTAFEQAFTDAAAMGVTICVAAGDNGSTDG
ncbi:MAG TPA: protease pro-enzyme activation domain-containing protein, partial [Burkholderiaceae bacterium]|nr:protease pro-enzyme activation domain-containing protein [Burkholderiaceae bacterium]